jgi:Cu/Ag efflux pump CusA
MAQFASFIDPFIILMAIPPGLAGVVLILLVTGSTLNIMSLMGVIMMTGIVVSNSILIVEFAGILHSQGPALLKPRSWSLQGAPAPHSDDLAGDAAGHDSHGARA